MGKETEIGWVNRVLADGRTIPGGTFNIVWGCVEAGPECNNCYAKTWANRMGYDVWGKHSPRRVLSESYWQQPIAWNRKAAEMGEVKLVFCSSMADVFEDHPTVNRERVKLWPLIQSTPWLTWLLLTKRPENIISMYPGSWLQAPPHNVWLGTSAGNQKWADRRIPALIEAPAVLRFVSCEPLLGPLDLCNPVYGAPIYGSLYRGGIGWVIAGGESASLHKARPMHPEWARGLRDQCQEAEIPYFFKQWGSWLPVATPRVGHGQMLTMDATGKILARPATWNQVMDSTGDVWGFEHYKSKHDTGRSLDGRKHSEIPEPIKPGQQLALF